MLNRWSRIERGLEWPVAILALLIVPALVLEDRTTDPFVRELAHVGNWVVWIAFCVEFIVRWAARSWSVGVFRDAWFDLLLIVVSPPFLVPEYLQGVRALRGLRAIRAIRLMRIARAGAVAAIGLRQDRSTFAATRLRSTSKVPSRSMRGCGVVHATQRHGPAGLTPSLWVSSSRGDTMANDIIPLRHIPISTTVDGVELHGEIDALYPNDITVIITVPVGGLRSSVHIPHFAMGHHQMAAAGAGRTTGITPYGRQSAGRLLKRLYEYSQGVRKGWRVDAVGPSGWIRLPEE